MKTTHLIRRLASWQAAAVLSVAGALAFSGSLHATTSYFTVNSDSDILGVANDTDAALINPWGIAIGPLGNLHVANNGTGTSGLYGPFGALISGTEQPHLVGIPAASGTAPGLPTGVVANEPALLSSTDTDDFDIPTASGSAPAEYLYGTEDGLIVGYRPGVSSTAGEIGYTGTGAGAGYTGVTLSWVETSGTFHHQLYAADFAKGEVDVFNSSFGLVSLSSTSFTDSTLTAVPVASSGTNSWSPFNVKAVDYVGAGAHGIIGIHRGILVAWAVHNSAAPLNDIAEVSGTSLGALSLFTTSGDYVATIDHGTGTLSSPWGLAIEHDGLKFQILAGSHGTGEINKFTVIPTITGQLIHSEGTLNKEDGTPLAIDGLWAVHHGLKKTTIKAYLSNHADLDEDLSNLYFSAGLLDETHGLVGRIETLH